MPSWKKIIVSGSQAHLAAVTASSGILVGSNQQITTSPSTTFLSGSFSGSFFGNGAGLTGVTATFPTTAKTDLATTDQFFINDGANKFITYGNLVLDLAGSGAGTSNLTTTDTGDSLALTSQVSVTGVTASFLGNLTGTASWASNATTAVTASVTSVTDTTTGTGPYYITFKDATTGHPLDRIDSTGLTYNATTNVITGTASYATTAETIAPAVTNNVDNRILTATGGGTINGEANLTFDGSTLAVTGATRITGDLTVSGSTTLGDASGDSVTVNAATVSIPNVGAGTTDTVIIRDGSNTLKTRTIDTRVWGSTLISGSGTANQVAFFNAATGITGASGFTFSSNTLTAPNVTITNNLIVQGTASFQETTNLTVADRFILLASGSNSAGEGGIVVQQATQGVGEVFAWDNDTTRWAVTSSFSANQPSFVPDAFMAAVVTAAGTTPSPATRYNAVGNIYVSSGDESIWIYS